ncbi:MAG: hypothetical protein WDZ59_08155 [Pirellulales bacterium]
MLIAFSLARPDRRRRVFSDERISSELAGAGADTGHTRKQLPADAARYTAAAAVSQHARVSDLVPRRYRTIALGFGVGAVLIAALETAYAYARPVAAQLGEQAFGALDLASGSSVASWFGAMLLAASALVSGLIYIVRRHRIDDYPGRYRVWLWAAITLAVISLSATSSFHSTLAALTVYASGWTGWRSGTLWWLLPGAAVGLYVGVRVLLDVRECRLGLASLVLATIAWSTALVMSLTGSAADVTGVMAASGATLGGHLLLLAGLVGYARYVLLDAENLLPPRKTAAKAKAADASKSPARKSTAPAPHFEPRRSETRDGSPAEITSESELETEAQRSRKAKRKARQEKWVDGRNRIDDPYSEEDTADLDRQKLSKAERKRLRKQKAELP